jgi:hypothetical protein
MKTMEDKRSQKKEIEGKKYSMGNQCIRSLICKKRLGEEESLACLVNRDIFAVS